MKIDLNQVAHKFSTLGNDWAEKEAAASLLEETRRSVRAEIALKEKDAKSVAERELIAEASEAYRQHIKATVEARRVANIARVAFDGLKAWMEMARTKSATDRAEMKL